MRPGFLTCTYQTPNMEFTCRNIDNRRLQMHIAGHKCCSPTITVMFGGDLKPYLDVYNDYLCVMLIQLEHGMCEPAV